MSDLSLVPGVVEWLSLADAQGKLPYIESRAVETYCIDHRLVRWLWSKSMYKITEAGRRAALNTTTHTGERGE